MKKAREKGYRAMMKYVTLYILTEIFTRLKDWNIREANG